MWNWKSGDTWAGIGIGAVAGALAGWGFAAGGTALASALGSALPSFSPTSIAISSFALAGGVMGGAAGFVTGFSGGYLYSDGNMDYALQAGGLYAGIGSAIGTTAGLIFGASEDARRIVNDSRSKMQEYYIASDGTHRKVEQYEYYQQRVEDGTAPDWMERNYERWKNKININTQPFNSQINVNYSNSIFMGNYNQTGNWQVYGVQAFDLNTNLQFGSNVFNYNIDNFFEMRRDGTINGIKYLYINTTGKLQSSSIDYQSGLVLRLRVKH